MTIVSAKEMLVKASQEKYAVGAFNITSVVQMVAVIEAAAERNAPVIVQTSVTPAKFLKPEVVVAVFRALAESVSIPVCLHLDHCTDVDFCKKCADLGYTNIMYDGSHLDLRICLPILKPRTPPKTAYFCLQLSLQMHSI